MFKVDKGKDAKNKQKLDLLKSSQNLAYILPPLDEEAQKCFAKIAKQNDADKIETVYGIELDTQVKKPFLKTPYNMRKNQQNTSQTDYIYRSPYTNQYFPKGSEGICPSPLIRSIEQKGQILFDQYAKMYYGQQNCISNFFVQENQDLFCFAYYVQKRFDQDDCKGIWNSTNVANISGDPTKSISYKVTTSVIYEIDSKQDSDNCKPFKINGNLKRTKTQNKKLTPDIEIEDLHLSVIGKAIQQNETFLRQQIQCVFARKTKQIVHKIRIAESKQSLEEHKRMMKQIMESNKRKMENSVQL